MAKARPVPGLAPDTPFAQAARLTVAVRAGELRDHGGDDVLDTGDIERVHDMRVATRRLRAVLELYEPCFERKAHAKALKEVKRLADALGARRDPDVQLERLEEFRHSLPPAGRGGLELLEEQLRAEQEAGNERLAKALKRARKRDLDGRLERLAQGPV